MASESDKKIIVFYILNILLEYTDENHMLKYPEIVEKLRYFYGVTPNVKSIASNINTLIEAGYEIVRCGKKGLYLSCRDFESGELMYLVDAVNSSMAITDKQAQELIEKLTKSVSKYERHKYKSISKVDINDKLKNKELFYVIEILNKAIEKGKKVKFNYNEYVSTKEMAPKFEKKEYLINPYFMVNSHGRYYLVCNYDKYDTISNYKIDRITNISIVDEEIKPISKLKDAENFSEKKYIKEHIYMTYGDSIFATLKVSDKKNINEIIEWFGDQIQIEEKDNAFIVSLRVNEQALIYWLMQYGSKIELLSPTQTREKLVQQIENLLKMYK